MPNRYRARDYHDSDLFPEPIELMDGTKWRVRHPRGSDRHRLSEIRAAQTARMEEAKAGLKDEAHRRKEEAERIGREAEERGEDRDTAARAYLDSLPELDTWPAHLCKEYLHAEVIAVFIRERPTAAEVLRGLGEDFSLDYLYEIHEEIMQAMSGDAAKKRLRGR